MHHFGINIPYQAEQKIIQKNQDFPCPVHIRYKCHINNLGKLSFFLHLACIGLDLKVYFPSQRNFLFMEGLVSFIQRI